MTIGGKSKRAEVKVVPILIYTLFGKSFALLQPIDPKYDAVPENRAGFARFYAMLPHMVNEHLRSLPVKPIDGELDGVFEALALLEAGKASGHMFAVKLRWRLGSPDDSAAFRTVQRCAEQSQPSFSIYQRHEKSSRDDLCSISGTSSGHGSCVQAARI